MTRMRPSRRAATIAYTALSTVDALLAGRTSRSARRARAVTKPLLMPALALTTASASAPAPTLVRHVRVAQGFSWLGDVALLGRSRASFLAGVAAFAGAHGAYIFGFAGARDRDATMSDPGPRAAAMLFAATGPMMARAAGQRDPALRLPILGYAGVLAAMFAASTVLDRGLPESAKHRVVAGTGLFLLSDSLLGVQRFLRHAESPRLETAVMATYTAGQWLIADGVVRTRHDERSAG
jgi:uncharacterized membrane protein YhhN